MTESLFIDQLRQLSESDWKTIFSGQALLMVNDCSLEMGATGQPNVVLAADFFSADDFSDFKQQALDSAAELYSNYYRTHPLTLYGFNDQFYRLVQQFSPEAFCAPAGNRAEKTLFVESGQLIVLDKTDPRYAYGLFCELSPMVKPSGVANHLSHWIEQGEAYEAYLSMNVCRYNC